MWSDSNSYPDFSTFEMQDHKLSDQDIEILGIGKSHQLRADAPLFTKKFEESLLSNSSSSADKIRHDGLHDGIRRFLIIFILIALN
jgi:hypothetical protein